MTRRRRMLCLLNAQLCLRCYAFCAAFDTPYFSSPTVSFHYAFCWLFTLRFSPPGFADTLSSASASFHFFQYFRQTLIFFGSIAAFLLRRRRFSSVYKASMPAILMIFQLFFFMIVITTESSSEMAFLSRGLTLYAAFDIFSVSSMNILRCPYYFTFFIAAFISLPSAGRHCFFAFLHFAT